MNESGSLKFSALCEAHHVLTETDVCWDVSLARTYFTQSTYSTGNSVAVNYVTTFVHASQESNWCWREYAQVLLNARSKVWKLAHAFFQTNLLFILESASNFVL